MLQMIRLLILVVAISTTGQAIAQRKDVPGIKREYYSNTIKKNFERLGIEWKLPPQGKDLMHNGLNSLGKGEWRRALKLFSQVIEFDSTFIPAYYFRISCYEIGEKLLLINGGLPLSTDKTFKDVDHVIKKLSRSNMRIYMDLWDVYVPDNVHSRKDNPLLEVAPPFLLLSNYLVAHRAELNPESFNYLKKSASSLLSGSPIDAIALNNKALEIERSTSGWYMKAFAFQLISQHDSAFHLYNKILTKDDRVIEAHENLALYKHQLNDRSGVLRHLSYLNNIEPNSPDVWRFSGMLKAQVQDYYGSIQDLTKYLEVDPKDIDCLKQRAVSAYEVKDYSSTLKDLDRAMKISRNVDIFLYLSETYLAMGDTSKCIQVLRDAEKIYPSHKQLDLFTADKLVEVNKTRQAQEIVDRIIKVVTDNDLNRGYLYKANAIQCKIYLRDGNQAKALQSLNSFIAIDGEQLDYLFLRAKIFLSQGEKDKAKIDLEKLVKADFGPAVALYNSL